MADEQKTENVADNEQLDSQETSQKTSQETGQNPDAAEVNSEAEVETPESLNEESLDAEALAKELAAAQDEIASMKDSVLRAAADVQNARRRAEQDVEKAHKFGLEKFTNEMLPIIDSLERALDACSSDDEGTKALKEGVEMTYKMFISGLAKFSVEQVSPEGEAFNPEHHQAMSMIESPDAAPNTVVAVMQKGYLLNGRLLRPAMVVVSKA